MTPSGRGLPRSRQERILKELRLRGSVRSAELAEQLDVDPVTIRRDIAQLDQAGLAVRVHGGALSADKGRTAPSPGKTLVGLLMPSTTSYFPDVIRGMEQMAASRGVRLVLGVSHYDSRTERDQAARLIDLGVEGLLVAPTVHRTVADDPSYLASLPVPVVLMERVVSGVDAGPGSAGEFDHVRTDHLHGAGLAVRHLARLGHEKVRLVVYDRTPTASWLRRGYALAVAETSLVDQGTHSVPKGEQDPALLTESLTEVLDQIRASGTTAVIAHTDYHAIRLVEQATAAGIQVPEDLSVIAYDDELASSAMVPLTAVTAPLT